MLKAMTTTSRLVRQEHRRHQRTVISVTMVLVIPAALVVLIFCGRNHRFRRHPDDATS
jgi:hypothetical protein